jgi:hypothetical protein
MSSVKTIAQFRQLRERALWKLLASHNAPIVLAVLQELLLGEHKVVPASALHERLTQELLALKQAGEDMTQSAQVQALGSPVTQGSSGCRDWTLDDGAHLAAELLLGLP